MGLSYSNRFWLRVFNVYRVLCGFRVQIVETEVDAAESRSFALGVFFDAGLLDDVQAAVPIPVEGNTSTIGIVKRKGITVGMIEIVLSENRFPVQYFFNVDLPVGIPKQDIAEISRLAVVPKYRKQNSIVSIALLAMALRHTSNHDIKYWIMCSPSLLRQGFRAFFGSLIVLPEKEVLPLQIQYRKHRESYFDPAFGVQVYAISIEEFSVWAAAKVMIRRRWARIKWKRQTRRKRMNKRNLDRRNIRQSNR